MSSNLDSDVRTTLQSVGAMARSAIQVADASPLAGPALAHGTDEYPKLMRKVAALVELKLASHATPGMACRPGCDHCCHRVVTATAPEVSAVIAHVADNFSTEQTTWLRGRLRQYVAEVAPHQGFELHRLRPACPFLADGLCSVYEVRPLACRSQFSPSAQACAAARQDPELPFPAAHSESVLGQAATKGILGALEASGRRPTPLDLGRLVYMQIGREAEPSPENFQFAVPALEAPDQSKAGGPGKYPTYGPEDEPIGTVETSDLLAANYYLSKGDLPMAFSVAPNTHPVHRLFRRYSPGVLMQAEDVVEARARFESAFRAFVEMDADPRQKFDAISEFSTLQLSYFQGDDRELLSEIGDYETFELTAKLLPDLVAPIEPRRRGGKLRVGYIGTQLDAGSSGYWATGWLRNHSRDIETFVYDIGRGKPLSNHYRAAAGQFFHLPGPVPETARFIKSHDLDVLIYPDLSCRGRPIQFATMRLARIQCAAWGGPGTTGLPQIDAFLSGDFMEPPNGQEHYRERLVRLPRTGLCYPKPPPDVPNFSKLDFGLDEGPLMLCAQSAPKPLPQWDYVFREITERTGRPIVFFRYPQWPHERLEQRLNKAGVRTIFMPTYSPGAFRALLRLADVALDTLGWSGGITAIESIGMGLPTVTLPGAFRRSRHTSAFLRAANAPGLIAQNIDDYIDLATNADRRHEAARAMTPDALYEDVETVRALEAFLHKSLAN